MRENLTGRCCESDYTARLESIRTFERQLTDNGYVLVKFFLQVSEKEQRRRLKRLESNIDTAWRVDTYDLWQNRRYDVCLAAFDDFLNATNTPNAPWYVIDSRKEKDAELQVLEALTASIETALENQSLAVPLLQNTFKLKKMPRLAEVNLDKKAEETKIQGRAGG